MSDDVIVVATWAEADALGARRGAYGHRTDPETGAHFISVAAGPRAIEGRRIGEVRWTQAATQHRGADELRFVLARSQLKMRRS